MIFIFSRQFAQHPWFSLGSLKRSTTIDGVHIARGEDRSLEPPQLPKV
jgi:hypothetical protein